MLACHIVKDLLPNYIDRLLSQETEKDVQQHLQDCCACQSLYNHMKAPIEAALPHSSKKDIRPFKKIRRRNILITVLSVLCAIVIVSILCVNLFMIGSTASTTELAVNDIEKLDEMTFALELSSTNGKRLVHFGINTHLDTSYDNVGEVYVSVNSVLAWPFSADNSYKTSFGFDEGALGCDSIKAIYLIGKDKNDIKLIWEAE